MWHVSVSVWRNGRGPLPCRQWTGSEFSSARKFAKKQLAGVGQDTPFLKTGDIAIHFRKMLTPNEIAMLDPEWMKLTPIDEAG